MSWSTRPRRLTLLAPDIPALVGNMLWGGYDLQTGAYYLNMASNELATQYKPVAAIPRSLSHFATSVPS